MENILKAYGSIIRFMTGVISAKLKFIKEEL